MYQPMCSQDPVSAMMVEPSRHVTSLVYTDSQDEKDATSNMSQGGEDVKTLDGIDNSWGASPENVEKTLKVREDSKIRGNCKEKAREESDRGVQASLTVGTKSVGSGDEDCCEKRKVIVKADSGDTDIMEMGSDGDSGCPSDCPELSCVQGPDGTLTAESMANSSGLEQTAAEGVKPKGKRRYYMYGHHKLIKPIKEIPLRFQILLAETSAAKARCEGQPIYMQPSVQYDCVYYQSTMGEDAPNQLNANATCFVPNQNLEVTNAGFVAEPYTGMTSMTPMTPCPAQSNGPSLQPAPLFVPPPGPAQPTANSSKTVIVYSSTSAPSTMPASSAYTATTQMRSVSIPPPPFPPPSSLPPPPVEQAATSTPTLSSAPPVPQPPSSGAPSSLVDKSAVHIPSVASRPTSIALNVPPPNHNHAYSVPLAGPQAMPATQTTPGPFNLPQHLALPTNLHASTVVTTSVALSPAQTAPSVPVPPMSVASGSTYTPGATSPYMYVYPSPPTGGPSTPTQAGVMYMVNPAYSSPSYQSQQFPPSRVLLSSSYAVPVQ